MRNEKAEILHLWAICGVMGVHMQTYEIPLFMGVLGVFCQCRKKP